ncbi:hypothetical protein HK097_000648 [Rhizophlyctis rosea]|uniref:Uncharacterized protein n=1 Tax=Rhizophlyctis rosea TaxID=64517 RepID=A0AAD5SDF9_9FUNG|nr:hypothetical protein HK097_000648 [Rhizophlyctis rosea]
MSKELTASLQAITPFLTAIPKPNPFTLLPLSYPIKMFSKQTLTTITLAFASLSVAVAMPQNGSGSNKTLSGTSNTSSGACASYTTTTTGTETGTIKFTRTPTPTQTTGAVYEAITVSGIPDLNAQVSIGANGVTYGLNGKWYGPTPLCSSTTTSESTTVTPVFTTVSADTEAFSTQVAADVTNGAAGASICFTATASPACPSGYTAAASANAGFVSPMADYNVQGVQTFNFGTAATPAACPCTAQSITVAPNFTPTGTVICATPSAGSFPEGLSYQSGTFTATATYNADALTCTSLKTETITSTSTLFATGTVGSSPLAYTTFGPTAVGGKSASATVCAPTPTIQPAGSCPGGYTSYTVTGTPSFAVTPTVTANGWKTQDNKCGVHPTAYVLGN